MAILSLGAGVPFFAFSLKTRATPYLLSTPQASQDFVSFGQGYAQRLYWWCLGLNTTKKGTKKGQT